MEHQRRLDLRVIVRIVAGEEVDRAAVAEPKARCRIGHPLTRDPRAIAIVLAQELSRIMNEPMAVSNAEFINSNETELHEFGSLERTRPSSPIALFAQVAPLAKP